MLMFLFGLLLMIPLSLMSSWWLVQFWFFFFSLLFIFFGDFTFFFVNLSFNFGLDYLSWLMVLLSFWICSLMIMSSLSISFSSYFPNLYLFMVLILMFSLYCTFCSLSLFNFYLFFEFSLIPTLMLILGWGYQPERISAALYLIIYTLLASLPLLSSILWLDSYLGGLCYFILRDSCFSIYFYFGMVMAFLVKFPVYMFHLWLPKAHVEAPVSGSMILAGVLLKLGGYGLIRVFKCISFFSLDFNFFIVLFSLFGGVFVSLICLRQLDIKMLIAYSSIAHMSLIIGGLFTMNVWGLYGSIFLMIGHGLCSSGLFCLSNISYERLGSRLFILNKGFISFMPSMTLWWFLLTVGNMSAPPSLNLMGEIGLFNSLISYSSYLMFFLFFMSFFGCVYSLYIYSASQHGVPFSGVYTMSSCYFMEFHLLFLHWLPLNIFFLCCYYF
uniref:NADH-ubiquinone oxidoreductase chain 4 n=1 Tax=Teredorus bashanensis TaxID=2936563 RepID=A0A8T9VUG0_9ORTH|nr:NADH dehydrogenase subunit 4 [Teredorus bashanensis]UPH84312.1 NADH dehydrogenase subunit 4 [Teredorus bashanensis]